MSARRFAGSMLAAAIFLASAAYGQVQALVTVDDVYGVPFGEDLLVESPGVLNNDTYAGEPAEDGGATAVLVGDVSFGTLSCESDPTLALCPDGSFTYTPGPSFQGLDSFIYDAVIDASTTSRATVTLTACSGGPTVFVCWQEGPYLAKLAELGYQLFQEGFEDDAVWDASVATSARSPETAPYVISQGIKWETNHPATNEISTNTSVARTGLWGVYDPEHGYATGSSATCDVNFPPLECLTKDGFSGAREVGESTLHGVGGYFTGTAQPNLTMILDGGAPIGLGPVFTGAEQFFGVIDTGGFASFRVEEIDGKLGQLRFVFGDDFTFGTASSDTTPPQVSSVNTISDTGDGVLSEGEVTPALITQLVVSFNELVSDEEGETGIHSVTNPANYLLFSDGGNGFDTVDCATGVNASDIAASVDSVSFRTGSDLTATLDLNGGVALPPGSYRLLVCGTTSIKDWAGNSLDGDGNGTGGDDFARSFTTTGQPGSLQFSSAAYSVAENGTTATITVTRTGGDFGEASVDYATVAGGTATAVTDYTGATGTITFADGDAVSKTFTVTIIDDTTYEGDETVNLALTNAVGASLGTPNTAVLTITEDDATPLTTWYVAPTGDDAADCITPSTPCLTIGEAVARAFSGDSIQVASGLYPEVLTLSKSLTVIGDGTNPVIEAPSGRSVVVTVSAGTTVTLSHFEIRNGTIGGVENFGDLTLLESWIHSNGDGSPGAFGGMANSGTGRIEGCTFSGNLGDTSGGVANFGQLDVLNSTIQGNAATFAPGIYNPSGATLDLRYSTVAENGDYGIRGGGTVRAEASIIALHATANCETAIDTLGHNLEDGFSCGLSAPAGDVVGVDPMLEPLGLAGGPTPTMALSVGSPAIDTSAIAGCPATDQRGMERPIDGDKDGIGVADIGAFEFQFVSIFEDGFESGNVSGWSSVVGLP